MTKQIDDKMLEFIVSLENEYITELFKTLPSGKKLRSKLILHIASPTKEAFNLCAIVELIHLASLLHDDVIDSSLTRRGKDSYNAKYGDKSAIMMGDILYSKAFFELTNLPKEVAQIISHSVSKLSIGEMLDVKLSNNFNDNKELYYDMIYKKTASLIEASSAAAAVLSNKDKILFETYGKNLGLAFQIVDDILDITQDSKTLGKPSLSDFKEGKTTLPYIYLHEALNFNKKSKLKSMFKSDLNPQQMDWIKEAMIKSGALEKSIYKAKELGKKALKAIENQNLPKLEDVVNAMIDREF